MDVIALYRARFRDAAPTRLPAPVRPRAPTTTTWASPADYALFRQGATRNGSTQAGLDWLLGEQ